MAKISYVADSSALIAYLRDEDGASAVDDAFVDPNSRIFCHALNLCEVYYDTLRAFGESVADEAVALLQADGLEIVGDMPTAFWKDAGKIKVSPGGLSLADCVAIALARQKSCALLTADHHEMDKLVGTGLVELDFVR